MLRVTFEITETTTTTRTESCDINTVSYGAAESVVLRRFGSSDVTVLSVEPVLPEEPAAVPYSPAGPSNTPAPAPEVGVPGYNRARSAPNVSFPVAQVEPDSNGYSAVRRHRVSAEA